MTSYFCNFALKNGKDICTILMYNVHAYWTNIKLKSLCIWTIFMYWTFRHYSFSGWKWGWGVQRGGVWVMLIYQAEGQVQAKAAVPPPPLRDSQNKYCRKSCYLLIKKIYDILYPFVCREFSIRGCLQLHRTRSTKT